MKKNLFLLLFCVFGVIRLSGMGEEPTAQAILRVQNQIQTLQNQGAGLQRQLQQLQNIEDQMRQTAMMASGRSEHAAEIAIANLQGMRATITQQITALQTALQQTIANAQQDLAERKRTGEEGIAQRSAHELGRINQRLQEASQEIRDNVAQQGRTLEELQTRIGREMAEHAQRELNEFLREATARKEQTSRELQLLADNKIRELQERFDETHAAAARAKREFRERMQQTKQEFMANLAEAEQRRHAERMTLEGEKLRAKGEIAEQAARTAREVAAVEAGTARERAEIAARAEVKKGREKTAATVRYKAEHAERLQKERLQESKQRIEETFKQISDMLNDGKTVRNLAITTGLTIAAILAVKHLLPIIRKKVEDALFTPPLIDDSSFTGITRIFVRKTVPDQQLANLYFNAKLKRQIDGIISVLRDTRKKRGYYLNYLFYGEPGTGKTATARALAYESGMDYAIMSGGNVQKLLATGKAEEKVKAVFKWAKKSKKGMLLFIDEADAFLKDPNKYAMTDELYAVLSSFLNLTGTESRDFALILSTNHPQNLPKAVLDRVGPGQFVYFGLPEYPERQRIVRHFVNKYLGSFFEKTVESVAAGDVAKPELLVVTDEILKDEIVNYIARKTEGFSGRNLSYLVLAIEKMLMAGEHTTITKALVDEVVEQAVEQKKAAEEFRTFA